MGRDRKVGRDEGWGGSDVDGIGAGDLGDHRSQLPYGLLGFLDRAGRGAAAVGEPRLHGAEPVGAEQLLQQFLAVIGVGVQELRELALGQQDDLVELLRRTCP